MSERNISEIIDSEDEFYRVYGESLKNTVRVACPGIVQSFNPIEQTVVVQPAIREDLRQADMSKQWTQLPLLLDVPVCFSRAGGYTMTMPIKQGDECLVIFLDSCMDAWWSYGGVQNQIEKRRHDLSDAIAIFGIWSQPHRLANYSTNSCQLRNDNGSTYIELKDSNINIIADKVNISTKNGITLDGIVWDSHTHTCPDGETSGPH
jgi:hypothetical protein